MSVSDSEATKSELNEMATLNQTPYLQAVPNLIQQVAATPAETSGTQTPSRSNGDIEVSSRILPSPGAGPENDRAISPVSTASSASEPPLTQRRRLSGLQLFTDLTEDGITMIDSEETGDDQWDDGYESSVIEELEREAREEFADGQHALPGAPGGPPPPVPLGSPPAPRLQRSWASWKTWQRKGSF
jgi:hypothetical protein